MFIFLYYFILFDNLFPLPLNIVIYLYFGICYIYKVESVGFGLSGLIIIPNPCMSVQYKSYADVLGGEGIVESYTVSLFGNVWTFRGDDTRLITEVRDRTVSLRDGLRPYSRIQGA